MDLDQASVETILLETFGFDVKSTFLKDKWNDSWNEALERKSPLIEKEYPQREVPYQYQDVTPQRKVPDQDVKQTQEFKEVPQKLTFARVNYYIGRESTDRDTEKQFNSWKMIKRNFECKDPKVQLQRNHFGSAPERDLDFAQASFCPTETRKCLLFKREEQYVLTSAGASWDMTYMTDTVRKRTEEFLQNLNDNVSILSFLRRLVESINLRLETISSSDLQKEYKSENETNEFLHSNGFCIRDQNGTCVALATCLNEKFDANVTLNLTEDDAIDCSHLPFWGSNFSEEDKFEFASKNGLLLFVKFFGAQDLQYLTSLLVLILLEANSDESYVSVSVQCNKTLCPQLSQSLGFLRCFDDPSSKIYDGRRKPPLYSSLVDLFRIFPSPSQVLGSLLLVFLQSQTKLYAGQKQKQKEDDSLTTIENSADRFNASVNVWRGSLRSLREQLVE
jgi:hypothetical protein